MKIKRFEFNMFPVNCYVLWDETKEAVVIDPGCFYDEEKQALKNFTKHTPASGSYFWKSVYAKGVRSFCRSQSGR